MRWARERSSVEELSYQREAEHLTLARVLIAQGQSKEAMLLLERLLSAAESGGRTNSVIEILVLQSLALRSEGYEVPALSALERALEFAAPEGYVRTFVDEGVVMARLLTHALETYRQGRETRSCRSHLDYIGKLLAAFEHSLPSWQTPPGVHRSAGPLSERELEVLELVAAGLKNQEIAQELFVVVGTVKAHINSIYRKLGVHSRVQAVSRAKELNLLNEDV
jgi:LuxR family maltose regulon positive regulatory protein